MDRSPHSVPNWSLLLYMRTPNLHSLIGLKGTVLIGQNGTTLVSEEADRDLAAQFQLDGESLSPIG